MTTKRDAADKKIMKRRYRGNRLGGVASVAKYFARRFGSKLMLGVLACAAVLATLSCAVGAQSVEEAKGSSARVVVLVVMDGLRPDLVVEELMPNLTALSARGVLFAHHHALFPSLTMVNAAGLATGQPPGVNGILGNQMYLALLTQPRIRRLLADFGPGRNGQVFLENSRLLARLNSAEVLNGKLVQAETIAQSVIRAGGYLALVGKAGPTFLFDDEVAKRASHHDDFLDDYLFIAPDLVFPNKLAETVKRALPTPDPAKLGQDRALTGLVIERALPGARRAHYRNRPALIVLWLRNPDFSQHRWGLGTEPALTALKRTDEDLGRLVAALNDLGMAAYTDVIVTSDHGFATIEKRIDLPALLASRGLLSRTGDDGVVVVRNGGADEIYLAGDRWRDGARRRKRLQEIVGFVAAQDWSGPIFSPPAQSPPPHARSELGSVPGTFNLALLGLYHRSRSPDLLISFRELTDRSNSGLTGPEKQALYVGAEGERRTINHSGKLVRPTEGIMDADTSPFFSTGMGMHGAAGERELHNFCAAIGPDFRSGFKDSLPTGALDLAPTIARLLGIEARRDSAVQKSGGRVLSEALVGRGVRQLRVLHRRLVAKLKLPKLEISSVLRISAVGPVLYLDSGAVTRNPRRPGPQR